MKGTYLGVWVIHGEIADNNRHGKGDREHTSQGAQRSYEHAHVGFRRHVAVPDGGHGDQGPPQTQWYAIEVIVGIRLEIKTRTLDRVRQRKGNSLEANIYREHWTWRRERQRKRT